MTFTIRFYFLFRFSFSFDAMRFDSMQMMWYQNSFLLDPTDRRSMQSKGDRYTLIIRNFQTSDFGNYRYVPFLLLTRPHHPHEYEQHSFIPFVSFLSFSSSPIVRSVSCVADNALGRTKKYIEISGRPGPAEFISPMFSGSLEYYNLTWSVESIPPLEEIRLLYRRLMVSDQVIIKRSHLFHWHVFVCVCARSCVGACLDERDISTSWQMARHSIDTDIDTIQWKSLHYVACDSWLGTKFRVRGNCSGEKSLRMEWGTVYKYINYIHISDDYSFIRTNFINGDQTAPCDWRTIDNEERNEDKVNAFIRRADRSSINRQMEMAALSILRTFWLLIRVLK